MKISDYPSRVSVAQRSEYRYVDLETLGSIPGWGSQSFRIYNYDRIKILSSYIKEKQEKPALSPRVSGQAFL